MRADGVAELNQSPATRAQVAGPNAANFKWQPIGPKFLNKLLYNAQTIVLDEPEESSSSLSAIFCPTHPPGRKHSRTGFRSRLGGTANYRLDPRAGCLVPVGRPVFPSTNWLVTRVWAKAHHVPRCAAQSLTASSLLSNSKDTPDQTPSRYCIGWPACGPHSDTAGDVPQDLGSPLCP